VNLVRLAVLSLSNYSGSSSMPAEWSWSTESDGVAVETHLIGEAAGVLHVMITTQVPLDVRPSRSESGYIVIGPEALRRCERVVEEFADLAAVAVRMSRKLSSPNPEVAFSAVTAEERAWLDESEGISRPSEWRGTFLPSIDLSSPIIASLTERLDGVALLAEALSIEHPTGRFRELLRVFERGFRSSPYRLVDPVADFLSYFDVLQYDKQETFHWFTTLRDKATHADKREDFALARDVEPVLNRVEQAAYDVLYNKLNWRSSDNARRDVWTPEAGVLPDGSGLLRQDARAPFQARVMDGFGAFPLNLEVRVGEPLSPDWWLEANLSDRMTRVGRIDVVKSFRSQRGG
jgi:hypothetical protein